MLLYICRYCATMLHTSCSRSSRSTQRVKGRWLVVSRLQDVVVCRTGTGLGVTETAGAFWVEMEVKNGMVVAAWLEGSMYSVSI
jgi:hypothetical protein